MEKLNMIKWIDETRNDGVSRITFKRDGNKTFTMSFEGNLDLYFSLNNFDNDPTFIIGKDNYAVYEIFEKLYNHVMNGVTYDTLTPAWLDDEELFEFTEEEKRAREKRKEENRKQSLKLAYNTGLITNGEIIWRSDDFSHDIAPYFKITKYPNAYMITFDVPTLTRKPNIEEAFYLSSFDYDFVTVRIRNSGSSYDMFHIPFMEAYNSLLALPTCYRQIHIEEFMIDEKLKSGESLEKILKKTMK